MAISMKALQAHLEKCAQCEDGHEQTEMGQGDEHVAMQKTAGMNDAQRTHHGRMSEFHFAKARTHKESAENFRAAAEKCSKTSDDELGKSSSDLIRRLDALENAVVPTRVSAVAPENPNLRAVTRTGQRPISDRPNVPVAFEKLVAIEE